MHEKRVEKALVVDANFHLRGMITVKDFQKAERKPNACKDEHGRLRVSGGWRAATKSALMRWLLQALTSADRLLTRPF
jgi:hypothetical protein